ncbi:secreted RxLR effector peptide protein, putative [Phytophthora infestans T30-4]|uniref:Secreted RxLR effector peptide protein, putative n=2 Tax=Phytophthora infestans TaxID=4787 RepID=D0NC58_PHYIT|nr:secreted RxLR effector peptide protein, putative [Phytophthora infestans T30-4]EEY55572.1 secreted RxLR effector peptide protein, putative [Phytophthora infestans T30-4]|eukprot:XP_002903148.1 secreted RxLR effector peptide protein, putative [Phytophthora infestans T30-4]
MRLTVVLLMIVATLLVYSEARSLRQGSPTSLTSKADADSEERWFVIRDPLSKAATTVEKVSVESSKRNKVLNKLAKILLPDTSDFRLVYKDGRWKSEKFF